MKLWWEVRGDPLLGLAYEIWCVSHRSGHGRYFATRQSAVRHVRALQRKALAKAKDDLSKPIATHVWSNKSLRFVAEKSS